MKRNLIAVTIVGVMSLLIFLVQQKVVENLREEISRAHVEKSLQQRAISQSPVSKNRKIDLLNPEEFEDLITAFRNQEASAEDYRTLLKSLELVEKYSSGDLFLILDRLNHERVEDPIISEHWKILFSVLAVALPMKTLEYLDQIPNAYDTELFRSSALRSLAERNPEEALAYLPNLQGDDGLRNTAENFIVKELALKSPKLALEYLKEFRVEGAWLLDAAMNQAARNFETREELRLLLANDLHEEHHSVIQKALLTSAYQLGGLSDFGKTFENLSFSNDQDRNEVLSLAIRKLQRDQPQETLDWLVKTLPAKDHARFVDHSVTEWASRDFVAAGEWLSRQKPTALNKPAYLSYAAQVARYYPEDALAWADQINDDATQSETKRKIVATWKHRDMEAASAWVERKGLSIKEWLLKE